MLVGALLLLPLLPTGSAAAAERTVTLRTGPYTLGGFSVQRRTVRPPTPGVDGFITRMRARIVDERGVPIDPRRLMLHHLLFLNDGRFEGDRYDGTCTKLPRERFFGVGEEQQRLDLPAGYGYPIRAKDSWRMNWMLMNHRRTPDTAFIEFTMTIDDSPLQPVKPLWLDVAGCGGGSIFSVPGGRGRGSTDRRSVSWTSPIDGRVVAGGAHLHGGAKGMLVSQPACGRHLFDSRPLYGFSDHPYYRVRPVLHEPGPIDSGWFKTATGLPVAAGETLKVTSLYDGERAHPAVMAIMHLYLAAGPPPRRCAPIPADLDARNRAVPGRRNPPRIKVPLTALNAGGRARDINRPDGKLRRFDGGTTVDVEDFEFAQPNISVPAGATIRWRFRDRALHNVTLANGPFGFASLHLSKDRVYKKRLKRPGTYRLFCSLHPVTMHQVAVVRGKKKQG